MHKQYTNKWVTCIGKGNRIYSHSQNKAKRNLKSLTSKELLQNIDHVTIFHIAKVPFIHIGQMYKKVMQNKMSMIHNHITWEKSVTTSQGSVSENGVGECVLEYLRVLR